VPHGSRLLRSPVSLSTTLSRCGSPRFFFASAFLPSSWLFSFLESLPSPEGKQVLEVSLFCVTAPSSSFPQRCCFFLLAKTADPALFSPSIGFAPILRRTHNLPMPCFASKLFCVLCRRPRSSELIAQHRRLVPRSQSFPLKEISNVFFANPSPSRPPP